MARIMIVDDDEHICSALEQFLSEEGHETVIVSNAEDAIKSVEGSPPDIALMDIRMPGVNGLEALERIRRLDQRLYVVMMTAYGTSRTSIEAMRLGAYDYLTKPFDLGTLRSVVNRALEAQALAREAEDEPRDDREDEAPVALVGSSPRMQEVYKLMGLLAARDIPALLVGERGVGKHLVAATIHDSSERKLKPFLSLSCRALPEELLAAELFGREIGGEEDDGGKVLARGKLETARGGTLVVEHVDALPLPLQARILEYLTDGKAQRVGGTRHFRSDARLIATSEENLGESVGRGAFNEELFDRLRVFSIRLPPLRERSEDIPELVAHFIRACNEELGVVIKGIDGRVAELFAKYLWPGNVGQLEHVIQRASALARGEVLTMEDFGESLEEGWQIRRDEAESALEVGVRTAWRLAQSQRDEAGSPFHEIIAKVEETLVREALGKTRGNQVQAALLLGVTRTTLRNKIERFGL